MLSVLCTVVAVVLHRANLGVPGVERLWIGDVVVGTAYPVAGALLVRRRPANPVGWVLVGCALVGAYVLGGQWYVRATLLDAGPLPLAALGGWLNAWAWVPHLLLPTLVPLLFPDGALPSPRWRWVLWTALGGAAVTTLTGMLGAVPLDASLELVNPWAVAPTVPVVAVRVLGLGACFVVAAPVAFASVVIRLRRAAHTERLQLLWLLTGVAFLSGSLLVTAVVPEGWEDAIWSVGLLGALLAIAVAVVRSPAFDVELALNRTMVALVLGGLVLAVHLVAVSTLESLVPGGRWTTLMIALASLLAVAAYERVQRLVDRVLLGGAADPYAVVVRVGGRLDLAAGPVEALEALVTELRDALRLPHVEVEPHVGALPPIAVGTATGHVEELAIVDQGQQVATLRVGRRPGARPAGDAERSLVDDVRRRAGALVRAAALVDDLRRSRERVVAGREEERRRLRHDLHDGVGPRLAGMALQLDSLADRLAADPDLHARAERVRDLMRATIAEVRQVVDDLRPPALDELGLVGAVRQHLSALVVEDGPGVSVVAGALPALPAAVEVAAHRIAVEAATNAVRHARATRVEVRLAVDGPHLRVEVVDDGAGLRPDATPGVGLASMRERAHEVGGRFEVAPAAGGGTVVRAHLPVPVAPVVAPQHLEPA